MVCVPHSGGSIEPDTKIHTISSLIISKLVHNLWLNCDKYIPLENHAAVLKLWRL